VALWRAQSEQSARRSLERRAFAVAALESARAQIFLTATLTGFSVFADDPAGFVDQYQQARKAATQDVQEARDKLAAVGGPDDAVVLDALAGEVERLLRDVDAMMASLLTSDSDARVEIAQQTLEHMWPAVEGVIAKLAQLAQQQESELASERAAADRTSETTLALLITFSGFAFLTGSVALLTLLLSVVRPLAALRASARAITSGNLEARANVSGPEEVASLARDFNEMTQAVLDRTARLQQSEQRFRDVLEVSRDLVYKLNLKTRTYDYVSPSAVQLVGFTPQEVTAMGLEEVRRRFHPEDRERFGASPGDLPDDTVEDRRAPTIEYRWQCKDGEYRWLSDNRAFVRDEDGRVLAVVGTVRDITEQKRIAEGKQKAFEDTVMLLAVAAEARDPYTENHLLRIRGYSEAIASELGLSPEETREIGLASLLHDIGKMRVPDPILTKPGPLTAEEWEIIKQHPIWGEELLSLHPSFESARQIARWHHENWDGTGYPDGLRSEEIPIGATITAVADGFDAMTTQRPYKGAWPPNRAIREIRQNKGRRYSPKVVEAFERALRKGEIKKVATTSPPSISELVKAA
jgi:PAS domain S-box-containing protein